MISLHAPQVAYEDADGGGIPMVSRSLDMHRRWTRGKTGPSCGQCSRCWCVPQKVTLHNRENG